MLQINKSLPMPAKKVITRNFQSKYPFKDMEVTNSFFVQGKNEGKVARYLSTIMSKAGKKLGKKFMIDEVPTGYNVFCIATGLGTANAKMYDFDKQEVIEFNDAPVPAPEAPAGQTPDPASLVG